MKKNKSFPQKEELQVDKQPVAGITQKNHGIIKWYVVFSTKNS